MKNQCISPAVDCVTISQTRMMWAKRYTLIFIWLLTLNYLYRLISNSAHICEQYTRAHRHANTMHTCTHSLNGIRIETIYVLLPKFWRASKETLNLLLCKVPLQDLTVGLSDSKTLKHWLGPCFFLASTVGLTWKSDGPCQQSPASCTGAAVSPRWSFLCYGFYPVQPLRYQIFLRHLHISDLPASSPVNSTTRKCFKHNGRNTRGKQSLNSTCL